MELLKHITVMYKYLAPQSSIEMTVLQNAKNLTESCGINSVNILDELVLPLDRAASHKEQIRDHIRHTQLVGRLILP